MGNRVIFSRKNLKGFYTFYKVGGVFNVDALGTMLIDGVGGFEGKLILNTAGVVTSIPYAGHYELSQDGTGEFNWLRKFADGGEELMHSHFVVLAHQAEIVTSLYSSFDHADGKTGEVNARMLVRISD